MICCLLTEVLGLNLAAATIATLHTATAIPSTPLVSQTFVFDDSCHFIEILRDISRTLDSVRTLVVLHTISA